jgi:hypothetical protein
VEAVVQRVGEGEPAEALQRLGDDEERHDPARQVADRVEESVVPIEGDHAADAEERRGRQVVAGEGHAVDEPVDLTVCREIALRGFRPGPEDEAEDQDGGHEDGEDHHRGGRGS